MCKKNNCKILKLIIVFFEGDIFMWLTDLQEIAAQITQKNGIGKKSKSHIVAVAGNPNVGKSTVFNALTGLRQHTGNWPGKTVENAKGEYFYKGECFKLVDIPGTYSLMASSVEEEIARDFICFGNSDAVIVVLDATALERNLNLALQILEITTNVVICVNLLDEAKKKRIHIDLDELSLQLGVPVVGTNARKGEGLTELMEEARKICKKERKTFKVKINYGDFIEESIQRIEKLVSSKIKTIVDARWLSLRMLDQEGNILDKLKNHLEEGVINKDVVLIASEERKKLLQKTNDTNFLRDKITSEIVHKAETIYKICVKLESEKYNKKDRLIDKILTSKITGIPVMLFALTVIFWLTISGANYPSEIIASGLFWIQDKLAEFFGNIGIPSWINNLFVMGIYRTLAWVVSVMLPPMAIFFPIFTFLEDVGYLPRAAFNLDKFFKDAGAHGKQALTMCMGFGCNACGVTGCRIIDSPRERLIAIITNNFVPCNGRIPTLTAVIMMFFVAWIPFPFSFLGSSLILTAVILLGIFFTFLISSILSKTLLRGVPSSFILELPPYRSPQVGKILMRSLLDRTIFVLGRAVTIAIPAGLVIWLMANIQINGVKILSYCSSFLDPFARLIGLDGVILLAFILGFPANEIVVPIIIMSYLSTGNIMNLENLSELRNLLITNGWTYKTAICTMLFSLLHFPCGTTLWTIKKETASIKWTVLSFLIPTVIGILVCFTVCQSINLVSLLINKI